MHEYVDIYGFGKENEYKLPELLNTTAHGATTAQRSTTTNMARPSTYLTFMKLNLQPAQFSNCYFICLLFLFYYYSLSKIHIIQSGD